jgi:hypothetical protein
VESHIIGLGLNRQACEYLHELFLHDIVTPSDQWLFGFLASFLQQVESGLYLEDGCFVISREGLEAGEEDDRY